MKKGLILGIVVLALVILGIVFLNKGGNSETKTGTDLKWLETELVDVRTGEKFKISDFNEPVLLESFAVWCPICTKQQEKIKELHDELGDSVVSVSIDTDPNEDEERVRQHIESRDFDWYYAVAPIGMTQDLVKEFGNSIVNAPSAPMVLVCEDKSFRKLEGFTVRSAEKLKEELDKGC